MDDRAVQAQALEQRILEELVYERVRVRLDLCDLAVFEADLSSSIDRALKECAASAEERAALVSRHLERAWQRLGQERIEGTGTRELVDCFDRRPPRAATHA